MKQAIGIAIIAIAPYPTETIALFSNIFCSFSINFGIAKVITRTTINETTKTCNRFFKYSDIPLEASSSAVASLNENDPTTISLEIDSELET